MKKLAIFFVLLALFLSCDSNKWDDSIINNTSAFDVKFKFNNTGHINLPAGEQATFPTTAYQHLESYSPEKRVKFTYSATNDGYTGEFCERDSWKVKVRNDIGEKATLSANGWMDDIIDIPPGDQSSNITYQKQVYTKNPGFNVKTESNFPVVAVYNRDANDPESPFYVTIQWSR